MCVAHNKNLEYDLAHHEFPIAQWLERPTGIQEGPGFDSCWRLRYSFSEYLDLRMLLHQ